MKKIYFILSCLALPLVVPYALFRYLILNKKVFKQCVDYRHLVRLRKAYQRQYENLQLELLKDEN